MHSELEFIKPPLLEKKKTKDPYTRPTINYLYQ